MGYFFSLILRNDLARTLLRISIIPFAVYCLFDLLTNDQAVFRNVPMLIEQIIFMSLIILVFFEKMKLNFQVPIYQTINFWILVGLFVYFSGIFFYILLAENYRLNERIRMELFMINTFVIVVKNLILGFALTVKEPEETPEEYEFMIPLEIDLDSFTPSNNLN